MRQKKNVLIFLQIKITEKSDDKVNEYERFIWMNFFILGNFQVDFVHAV